MTQEEEDEVGDEPRIKVFKDTSQLNFENQYESEDDEIVV